MIIISSIRLISSIKHIIFISSYLLFIFIYLLILLNNYLFIALSKFILFGITLSWINIIPISKFPIIVTISFNDYFSYNKCKNKLIDFDYFSIIDKSYITDNGTKIYSLGLILYNYYQLSLVFKVKINYYNYQITIDYYNPNK